MSDKANDNEIPRRSFLMGAGTAVAASLTPPANAHSANRAAGWSCA